MTLLLSLRKKAPSGLAEDGHPLRGGEETTMYDFLHTLFVPLCTCTRQRKEIPPNTFLRLSSFDPAVKIRTTGVAFLPTLYNLVPVPPPIQGPAPPYFSPNSPPFHGIPANTCSLQYHSER